MLFSKLFTLAALAMNGMAAPAPAPVSSTTAVVSTSPVDLEKRGMGWVCAVGCGFWCVGAGIGYEICMAVCVSSCLASAIENGELDGVTITNGTAFSTNAQSDLFSIVDGQVIAKDGTNINQLGATGGPSTGSA